MKIFTFISCLFLMVLISCKVDNLDDFSNVPKADFNNYDYVLATEDASDVDITTFFTYTPSSINPEQSYDLLSASPTFINSNPSTSGGFYSLHQFFFSMAKDKKGYSSTPGLYRLTLNKNNQAYIESELHISKENLFPARQLSIVNPHLGYYYDEGRDAYGIQIFDPSEMRRTGSINLKNEIAAFRPDVKWTDPYGNNLVRLGTLVLDANQGKLYVSVVFLEAAEFNLISESEQNFYVAVIDTATQKFEKIISYHGAKTVGFFVSENKATTVDSSGNMYFCSWGWNQFNAHDPSKVFRIKSGETTFDQDWKIDIEKHFGPMRIAQSMIAFNDKIYLHISETPYGFSEEEPLNIRMAYYEVDPHFPDIFKKLNLPESNASSRMNVFSIIDDKLFIAVPNITKGKFNGMYSLDKQGNLKKELTVENKYRPIRLYHLKK